MFEVGRYQVLDGVKFEADEVKLNRGKGKFMGITVESSEFYIFTLSIFLSNSGRR